jgi:hypothetical protein
MAGLYKVEVEPEVRVWLDNLSDRDFGRIDFLVRLLAERSSRPVSRTGCHRGAGWSC